MPKQSLEAQILRQGRELDRIEFTADPADTGALEARLVAWLEGQKWDRGRWGEFVMVVRRVGRYGVLKKIRVPA